MRNPESNLFRKRGLILAAAVLVYCAIAGIPAGEGFNPSDDGVVLAQSWRILQGEVPHRDFISIRPAGSGYMHLLDYLLPGPLEWWSRLLVIYEYLIYSILITVFLIESWFPDQTRSLKIRLFYLVSAGIFLLNMNHYNLYAWTTIDALFWFSVALFSYKRWCVRKGYGRLFYGFLSILGCTASTLCRQTFLLPALILMILVFRGLVRTGSGKAWLAAASGLLPGLLYAGLLTVTGSWGEFLRQMTGRTELWQTGFAAFGDHFWKSYVFILPGLALVTGLWQIWTSESGKKSRLIMSLLITQKIIILIVIVLSSLAVFVLPAHLFSLSFTLFWMLTVAVMLVYFTCWERKAILGPAFWILLLAWTASISLGDNSPVFTTGWLAGCGLLLLLAHEEHKEALLRQRWVWLTGVLVVAALTALSVPAQRQQNYRDLPSAELTKTGGELFRDLDHIRMNPSVYSYFSDIRKIYEATGLPKGRFAVWPNNPLIYRLLSSPNPFPLDWMQAAEFAGSEERLLREVKEKLSEEGMVILVERYNAKWIARDTVPLDWESGDYPYLDVLRGMTVEDPSGSVWFRLFRSK